jgi:hypothetical protein
MLQCTDDHISIVGVEVEILSHFERPVELNV